MKLSDTTPRRDGFRMPAEWEAHERCWLGWPTRPDLWPDDARPAQEAFSQVANAIAQFEPVTVCVPPGHTGQARQMLPQDVSILEIPCNDVWLRDTGPTFITDGKEVRAVDWKFNAWGGLVANYSQDEMLAERLLDHLGLECYIAGIVMEGGSFAVNGEGMLITTESCLLNANRNPGLSRNEIEEYLKNYLNVDRIIWLPEGVCGDYDTDGHVDNLCCFAGPRTVLLTWTDDTSDPQHIISEKNFAILTEAEDLKGRKLEVVKVHQPPPVFTTEADCNTDPLPSGEKLRKPGRRLAASYINCYIANGGVVLPGFGDETYDRQAMETFRTVFPSREVLMVPSREIVTGGGNIHCITQQQPIPSAG